MANIIYIGHNDIGTTAAQRANALKRIGNEVQIFDPYQLLEKKGLVNKYRKIFHYKTGYRFFQKAMLQWIVTSFNNIHNVNLIWIDSGELFGAKCILKLRKLGIPIVLYNVDDPTGQRDKLRFFSLLKAISLFDLVVVVRKQTLDECVALGAKNVMRVFRSYDEVAHKQVINDNLIPTTYKSDIVFIGTWMHNEERDKFLKMLIDEGLNVSIWGARWNKSPLWNELRSHYQGGALSGDSYVFAIRGAKLCIGLLSKTNRDEHTTRSMEIPYAGGLLCAERTGEHLALYQEWEEAVFWNSAEECTRVCKVLLNDETLRERIREAGMKRVRENKCGNEDICKSILDELKRLGLL